MMAATDLSQKQLNFARFSIVCLDIIKLPLIDILDQSIKPKDLSKNIHACRDLLNGEFKLKYHEKRLCCLYSSKDPIYNKFDISLLYKLMRNLCPQLQPTNNWGQKLSESDVNVGDDIERIRDLRNKNLGHRKSAKIKNSKFTRIWDLAKRIIQRLESYTKSLGCNPDYVKQFEDLERNTLTFDEYITQKNRLRGKH